MAHAEGLRASRAWWVAGLAGIAGIALWPARPPDVEVIPPSVVACATSLSTEPQDMCGPFASASEVFGDGAQVEDFEAIGGPPFEAVTVLTHGDAAHADFGSHARVALVVRIGGGWWGVELGSSGPVCIQASTVEDSGPAWIETTTSDLRVERGAVHVTKHDLFTRRGAVSETLTDVTCSLGATGAPQCRRP